MPSDGQIALLLLSIAFFATGGILSLVRVLRQRPGLRLPAKICAYLGVGSAIAVVAWHTAQRGTWIPLNDNFDALTSLGVVLALFVLYVQRSRPLGGLDWFVMPIVILLLAAALVFGSVKPHAYATGTWFIVHYIAAFGGAVAFAVAAAVGAMYLITNHRLRRKSARPGVNFGSLERLEHLTMVSVTLGFALLTVSAITGVVRVVQKGGNTQLGPDWFRQPKVLLTAAAWVIYALVLHAPINPRFRGRRAAALSIIGFVLVIGILVVVQFMSGNGAGVTGRGGVH